MKKFKRQYVKTVKSITCDRCSIEVNYEDLEFPEFTSIDYRGGYKSIFGDGCDISIDLCQLCLREILGNWLTVGESHYLLKRNHFSDKESLQNKNKRQPTKKVPG